jgi:hypothetical protein
MVGVREQIERADIGELVARSEELLQVARQRHRVAGYIDNVARLKFQDLTNNLCAST